MVAHGLYHIILYNVSLGACRIGRFHRYLFIIDLVAVGFRICAFLDVLQKLAIKVVSHGNDANPDLSSYLIWCLVNVSRDDQAGPVIGGSQDSSGLFLSHSDQGGFINREDLVPNLK